MKGRVWALGLCAVGLMLAFTLAGAEKADREKHHHHPPTTTTVPRVTTTTNPQSTTTTLPTTTTTVPSGNLKPRLAGLVWLHSVPANLQSVVKNFTLNIDWAAIEPTQGNFDYSAIDSAVATAHNLGERILLRPEAGIHAPTWVLNIGGSPVQISDPQGGGGGLVGRFWTTPYIQAYADFMAHLGARYDSDSEIGKVAVTGCMTVFAECYHLGGSAGANTLHGIGLTEVNQAAAIAQNISDTIAAFPTTEVHLALVNEQNPDNNGASDDAFTIATAAAARNLFGHHLVTGWNGSRDPLLPLSAYQVWIANNAPADGQTATFARVGNPFLAVDEAVKILHYGSDENSGHALDGLPLSQLAILNAELVANAVIP